VSSHPDLDRVADVLILVALRLSEHDKEQAKGDPDVDSGVLPRLD
jgi:hypothetical protein